MLYNARMGSERYREIFSTATLNIIRAGALARSTRAPWAVRNLFRARDRGRLQLLLLHGLVATALQRHGATGPLDELIDSPDPQVEELAWLGVTLDYALGTYLNRAEYLISDAYDAQTLELESLALARGATHPPREDSSSASSRNPLELIPSIQPNAPSA